MIMLVYINRNIHFVIHFILVKRIEILKPVTKMHISELKLKKTFPKSNFSRHI